MEEEANNSNPREQRMVGKMSTYTCLPIQPFQVLSALQKNSFKEDKKKHHTKEKKLKGIPPTWLKIYCRTAQAVKKAISSKTNEDYKP